MVVVSGTVDVDLGSGETAVRLASVVPLGLAVITRSPTCGGPCTAPPANVGDTCSLDIHCDTTPGSGDGVCSNFDPIPGGETTDYVPFSDGAKSVFGYVGVDLTLHENVHLIPNVLMTVYGEAEDGTTPGTDVMPRLTLFFSW